MVNLFLVGAMKCGTTSVAKLLNSSEFIDLGKIKEPHFFVDSIPVEYYDTKKHLKRDSCAIQLIKDRPHIANVKDVDIYHQMFTKQDVKYKLDASTGYFQDANAAKRIFNYNKNAKIVILLRNPEERIYSQYKMLVNKGLELPDFREYCRVESNLMRARTVNEYNPFFICDYNRHIKKYTELFGDNVLVLDYKTLARNPLALVDSLERFLAIDLDGKNLKYVNETRNPLNSALWTKYQNSILRSQITRYLPRTIKEKAFSMLSTSSEKNGRIEIVSDIELVQILRAQYELIFRK